MLMSAFKSGIRSFQLLSTHFVHGKSSRSTRQLQFSSSMRTVSMCPSHRWHLDQVKCSYKLTTLIRSFGQRHLMREGLLHGSIHPLTGTGGSPRCPAPVTCQV